MKMPRFPTYISLDIPEPMAAAIVGIRRILDPDFAHLPVEVSVAGSSGLGTATSETSENDIIAAVERVAHSFFPVTTRFVRSAWLSDLRVYALEVDAVAPLLALHNAIRSSGLAFEIDVPRNFHPHCTLRWTPAWMTPAQERSWNDLVAPQNDFVLRSMSVYTLAPSTGNAEAVHTTLLGA